jgi:hypothetical protein
MPVCPQPSQPSINKLFIIPNKFDGGDISGLPREMTRDNMNSFNSCDLAQMQEMKIDHIYP